MHNIGAGTKREKDFHTRGLDYRNLSVGKAENAK